MIRVVFATETAPYQLATGVRAMVVKGSHWPADDPVVRSHPEWFSEDPRYGMAFSEPPDGWDSPVVETATANPGERRNTRRGAERD